MKARKTIVFDQQCGLCSYLIIMITRTDKNNIFSLTPAGSRTAQFFTQPLGITNPSMVLLDGAYQYTKSTALCHILFQLLMPYRLMSLIWLIPYFIRDFLYWIGVKYYHILQIEKINTPAKVKSKIID